MKEIWLLKVSVIQNVEFQNAALIGVKGLEGVCLPNDEGILSV